MFDNNNKNNKNKEEKEREEKEKGEEEKEKGEEEKEKKFLQTGGHTDQSKVVQEVLMDLKMKKGNLQPQPNKGVKIALVAKGSRF